MTTARANVGVAVIGSRLYAVGGFSGMVTNLVQLVGWGGGCRIDVGVTGNGGLCCIMFYICFTLCFNFPLDWC
jgi:hypothetical protein